MREKHETGSSLLFSPQTPGGFSDHPLSASRHHGLQPGCFLTLALQVGGEKYLWCERTGERVEDGSHSSAGYLVTWAFSGSLDPGRDTPRRETPCTRHPPTHVTARVMTGARMDTRSDGSPCVGTSRSQGKNEVLIQSVGFQSGGRGFRHPLCHLPVRVTVSELLTSLWWAVVTPRDTGPDQRKP